MRTLSASLIALLSLGIIVDGRWIPPQDGSPGLFTSAVSSPAVIVAGGPDPTVIRQRLVAVNFAMLPDRAVLPQPGAPGTSLLLNVFADTSFVAVPDRIQATGSGIEWVGHVDGVPLSTVTLITEGDTVAGSIIMPGGTYAIRRAPNGSGESRTPLHVVSQVDQSAFPHELDPVEIVLPAFGPEPGVGASADSGATIDVMILYTPAAAAAAGGASAMSALINLGISETNTSYGNSGITPRLRLVYSAQVSYTETPAASGGGPSDLTNLQGGVGALRDVAGLRDSYGADLVSLVIANTNVCGTAYFMAEVSAQFAPFGFNVVNEACISPNFSLAHELGHNMGARHDWYVDAGIATVPFSYAHGYVNPATGQRWRTIMAYNDMCIAQGNFNCTRLLYWSNPSVSHPTTGAPMGIAGGTKTGCAGSLVITGCDADDHLALNNTAVTVANFRAATGSAGVAPAITVQPASVSALSGTLVSFTAAATGSPAPSVQWQVSINNGSTFSTISGATSTTYSFTVAALDTGKQFRAVFTNSAGAVTTGVATLTVNFAPVVTTQPLNQTVRPGATAIFTVAASGNPTPAVQWQVSMNGGSTFTPVAGATATTYSFAAAAVDNGKQVRALLTNSVGTGLSTAAVLTVSATAPTMSLDKTALVFGAVNSGAAFTTQTPGQSVRLVQSGAGTVTWTAASTVPWLVVSPVSGTGSATLTISTQFGPGLIALQTGNVHLTFAGAGNSVFPVVVTLNVLRAGGPPTGSFDTPADGSTGLNGSIAATGWALDDIEVTEVQIWRDPNPGDPSGATFGGSGPQGGKVLVGYASFVEGARPDVQTGNPAVPRNSRAGWGYLMLTRGLIWDGKGSFKLYAIAADRDGHLALLGSRTISVNNAAATKPFGAIDTPGQGATATGMYPNTGWVLTPNAGATIPAAGVQVAVDGVFVTGVPSVSNRTDISTGFPGFTTTGAGRGLFVDTTVFANGVHTIGWLVTDSTGKADGVGSRFFTVANSALVTNETSASSILTGTIDSLPLVTGRVSGRRGFDRNQPLEVLQSLAGRHRLHAEELDRIEVRLADPADARYTGYARVGAQLVALPIGSHLKGATFSWQLGAGFFGTHHLVFVREGREAAAARQEVQITIHPQGTFTRRSGRIGLER